MGVVDDRREGEGRLRSLCRGFARHFKKDWVGEMRDANKPILRYRRKIGNLYSQNWVRFCRWVFCVASSSRFFLDRSLISSVFTHTRMQRVVLTGARVTQPSTSLAQSRMEVLRLYRRVQKALPEMLKVSDVFSSSVPFFSFDSCCALFFRLSFGCRSRFLSSTVLACAPTTSVDCPLFLHIQQFLSLTSLHLSLIHFLHLFFLLDTDDQINGSSCICLDTFASQSS